MAIRLTNPFSRYFTDNAALLSGGKLNFFEDDGGTTRKDTFSVNALTPGSENANPVILSSSGVMPDIFLDGAYRVTLENSAGVQLDEADNVNAGTGSTAAYAIWAADVTYDSGREVIVTASDDKYYFSTSSANLGNDPIVSPGDWSFLDVDAGTVTATGAITGDTLEATGDTSAGDNAAIGWTTTEGIIVTGDGSVTDMALKNNADANVMTVATGTQIAAFLGVADFSAAGFQLGNETLSVYDVSTWTPNLSDGTNTDATLTTATGRSVRTGAGVFISCHIITSDIGSLSGTIRVINLPVTSSSSTGQWAIVGGQGLGLGITATANAIGMIGASTTEMFLHLWDATSGTSGMTAAEWSSNGQLTFSGFYEA